MGRRTGRWFSLTLRASLGAGLVLSGGCLFPVRDRTDQVVCDLAEKPLDAAAPTATPDRPAEPPPTADKPRTLADRLRLPAVLPGADAPPLILPRLEEANQAERNKAIGALFPELPPVGETPAPRPGPEGKPLTLAQLQQIAMSTSPLVRQAAADVEAARGNAIQVGLPPNPNVFFYNDTIATAGLAGYPGGGFDQTWRTANKLGLARAAAMMDLRNAEAALKRAQSDLTAQVRGGYFAVLVAAETVRVSEALYRFTEEVYRIQVEQVKGAQVAAYEPLQLRVLTQQARIALVQARNRYTAAWKQLAATLGTPDMPPVGLAGRVDQAIPEFKHDLVLDRVLRSHTDVITAENGQQKARYNLKLAQLQTAVTYVDFLVLVQKDYTSPTKRIAPSFHVTVPLPVWDRNQGGVMQAQAALLRATEEAHRVRDDLTSRVADAFERYDDNRQILELYRSSILADQVRAYRGIYERHQQQPDMVGFGDIVAAQQTLAGTVTTYVTTLTSLWQAVTDLGSLLQIDDLYETGVVQLGAGCGTPDLHELLALPCTHCCSPVPAHGTKGAEVGWPKALPSSPETEARSPAVVPPQQVLPVPAVVPTSSPVPAPAAPPGLHTSAEIVPMPGRVTPGQPVAAGR